MRSRAHRVAADLLMRVDEQASHARVCAREARTAVMRGDEPEAIREIDAALERGMLLLARLGAARQMMEPDE